ncbi:MAG: alpha/beta hydrolase [Xenococcaceae cyanobacterium MO_207.B15]|nr:alpha/beta hydrolase [Xenococcaceae cyanobacterium MO_207.B15]
MIRDILYWGKNKKNSLDSGIKRSLRLPLVSTLIHIGFCLSFPHISINKVSAAEDIFINYGPVEFSLSIQALETYARTGKIEANLADYARFLNEEQLEQLKTALVTNADISHLSIAQFFYSYQGEKILERIGQVIQTKSGQSGFYAIRSALIMAAADEEGLTPLNFLNKFPTKGIRINSEQGFEIIKNLSDIIRETNKAIADVEQKAQIETLESTVVDLTPPPDFSQPGNLAFRRQLHTMRDTERRRIFPVEVYLPELPVSNRPLPLVVISHGLGSDRHTFAYLAKHLASYGFAVAVPEHPGSNSSQIQNLLEGLANDVTPPEEFIDRPLDITYLLDQLTVIYGGKLNTNQVGIIGQSFGGYTALALAGAQLNFPQLQAECKNLNESFNVSLLLQCLALESSDTTTNLRDERITSAIAINPLTSAIFGQEGMAQIDIPIMLISGSADPVTPAVPEQIKPFTWLTTTEKYLTLLRGGTHFSVLNESSGSIPVPEAAIGPDPKIAQKYIKQLGFVFFSAYVKERTAYLGYLNADYGTEITDNRMPLSILRCYSKLIQSCSL